MTENEKSEKIIDLDDPSLQEAQNYDPEADADQFIPPPELDSDGNAITYAVRLSLGKNKFEETKAYYKEDKKGRPMAILMVDVEIVDDSPEHIFDKARLSSEYFNTYVNPRTKASSYTNIARLLGSPFATGLSVKEQSEILEPLIASEPVIGARIQWGAYCKGCEEEKMKFEGERKWPVKVDGNGNTIGHIPLAECDDCATEMTPKISVKRFVKL